VALSHFLGLFPRRDKYIEKLPGRDWQWKKTLLHDYQIAGVISDDGRGLHRGCAWAHKTRFGTIDIDQGSNYRTPQELAELTAKFAAVNLNLVPYQSSDSGGWHLYFFLEEWAESEEINSTLKAWLKANGYEIRGGILEVFPSGQGLRLPLQKGFAWLDASGNIIKRREELAQEEALALFLADMEYSQTNWQKAKELIEAQLQLTRSAGAGSAQAHEKRVAVEGSEELFTSGIDWEKYHRGREYWLYGLTGPNQRHDAVCSVGHYLWYGDSSQGVRALPYPSNAGARAELILEWLKEKHNGHSEEINQGQWSEVEGQIERACYWTAKGAQVKQRESYPLTERLIVRLCETQLTPEDFKKANRRKEGAARSKIKRALAQCVAEGSQVTRNRLALISGCSPNTVSKHADLWSLLAAGSHAYIRGGLGGSSEGVVRFGSDVLGFEPFCSSFSDSAPEVEFLDQSSSVIRPGELADIDPLNSSESPLLFCLATSLPPSTQSQDRALRVPAAVLTLGSLEGGNQAEQQMCAGGISLSSGLVVGRFGEVQDPAFWQKAGSCTSVVGDEQGTSEQVVGERVALLFSKQGESVEVEPGSGREHSKGSIAWFGAAWRCRGP